MRNQGIVLLFLALLLLSGCQTTPTLTAEASRVDAAPSFAVPFPHAAMLVITRDSGVICFASPTSIFVDGTLAGKLGTGDKLELYVSPGTHVIGAMAGALCPGGTAQTEATVAGGQVKNYRTGFQAGPMVLIEPTAF